MNFWIYSKTTKLWYTPEEFIWSNEDINVHRGKANAPQLILMDPREGLKKANDLILRASKFVEEHTKKINQYYDLKKK
ncbi:hypothetical protein [Pedobacter nototheniae]|uniref:hypothetical protein n=1 Tax=Pedobacter nototheniae TaxID=2488994 RepID=UPI00103A0505|nr:hypothetical protein [Pedobacter nototheniae]